MGNTTDTVDLPTVDSVTITNALYNLPNDATSQMYAVVLPMDMTRVTSGTVIGTGAFDLLMAGIKAQLRSEYDANRITGGEYTKAFIELTTAALQNTVQFLLGSEQAFWASQTAQIQAITGRIGLETARFTYENLLPAQFALVAEQGNQARAQTSDTRLDGTPLLGVMGSQEALYKQQIISYKRDAEVKAAKIFTDAWITQKTMDDGLLPPNNYTNAAINTILTSIMTNNVIGVPEP